MVFVSSLKAYILFYTAQETTGFCRGDGFFVYRHRVALGENHLHFFVLTREFFILKETGRLRGELRLTLLNRCCVGLRLPLFKTNLLYVARRLLTHSFVLHLVPFLVFGARPLLL